MQRIAKPCANHFRGCSETIEHGKICEKCRGGGLARSEQASPAARGYGRSWQAYRLNFLREHPLCVDRFEFMRNKASSLFQPFASTTSKLTAAISKSFGIHRITSHFASDVTTTRLRSLTAVSVASAQVVEYWKNACQFWRQKNRGRGSNGEGPGKSSRLCNRRPPAANLRKSAKLILCRLWLTNWNFGLFLRKRRRNDERQEAKAVAHPDRRGRHPQARSEQAKGTRGARAQGRTRPSTVPWSLDGPRAMPGTSGAKNWHRWS